MTKPFKFRHVNEIAGSFVLLIAILVVTGIYVVAHAQGWFKPEYTLRVKLPPEGSAGIQKGAEVNILGTPVGRVDEVIVNDDGSMETVLKIKMRFTRFIREDSKAILKKQFGVAGDAFMEIIRGSGRPLPNGSTLPAVAQKDAEIVELLQELVEKLQDSALPILDQAQKAVVEYTALAADMRKPDGHLQQILARIEELVAGLQKPDGHMQQILARIDELITGLQKGDGTAGKLLKDPATVNGVNEAIRSINVSLVELQGIVADIKKTTENLPETAQQTRATLRQAEILIEGVQKHWLLRSYVEQQEAPALIPSTDVPTQGGK